MTEFNDRRYTEGYFDLHTMKLVLPKLVKPEEPPAAAPRRHAARRAPGKYTTGAGFEGAETKSSIARKQKPVK
jgi:hypothetical protein